MSPCMLRYRISCKSSRTRQETSLLPIIKSTGSNKWQQTFEQQEKKSKSGSRLVIFERLLLSTCYSFPLSQIMIIYVTCLLSSSCASVTFMISRKFSNHNHNRKLAGFTLKRVNEGVEEHSEIECRFVWNLRVVNSQKSWQDHFTFFTYQRNFLSELNFQSSFWSSI